MLQDIRKNSQGTVAKLIVGLIVVVFALFGVESIVGGLSGEPEVATVNGKGITESKFARAVEGKRRQILAQMGERADPDLIDEGLLRSSVLEGMITEEILVQDAEEKGLFVADAAVDDYIRGVEQFKIDGVFSNERMQMVLRNAGLTLKAYRDSLKSQFVLNQTRSGLIASAFVLGDERDEVVALDRQQRSFGVATVFKRDYLDAVTVSDEEISVYYEKNKDSYQKPKSVDVSYIELNKSDLGKSLEVDEAEVQSLYDTERAEFVGEEERVAAHILIKIDENSTDEQALTKIKEIEVRIKSGEEFSVLAKELSEDEGSSQNGGDLGRSGKGVYVSDFEDALFALNVGQISAPVKTEFGYHLIKLAGIEANEFPAFDEMRAGLEERLRQEAIDQLYVEKSEMLADISYSSPDLAESSDELSLDIQQLAGVSLDTKNALFSNAKVRKVLFSDDLVVGQNNSELIEVGDGQSLVFRVDAYNEASVLPLVAVKGLVRNTLKGIKSSGFAESVGQEFIARVVAGEEPKEISDDMGLNWRQHKDIKRDNIMVNREVITRIFALEKTDVLTESIIGFDVLDGDYAIVRLDGVVSGDTENTTSLELHSISNMLGDGLGAADYRNYQSAMAESAEIERQ